MSIGDSEALGGTGSVYVEYVDVSKNGEPDLFGELREAMKNPLVAAGVVLLGAEAAGITIDFSKASELFGGDEEDPDEFYGDPPDEEDEDAT